ncbi:Card1-like endonuclease domain-containing protein [Hydrogenimonas sp.]
MTLVTIAHADRTELIPLLFEHKEEIRRHIVLNDKKEDDRFHADALVRGLGRLKKRYRLKYTIQRIEVDEDDRGEILHLANALPADGPVALNAAGADLALTTMVGKALLDRGGETWAYDTQKASYNRIGASTCANHPVQHPMKLDDFFDLMAIERFEYASIDPPFEALSALFGDAGRFFRVKSWLLRRQYDRLESLSRPMRVALGRLGLYTSYRSISKDAAARLGRLFEAYVHDLAQRVGFDDTMTGVTLKFHEARRGDQSPLMVTNEFDVMVMHRNRPCIVECKTGLNASTNPLEIVYKVDALMDFFGQASRGLVIHSHDGERKGNLYSDTLKLRASRKGITILDSQKMGPEHITRALRQTFL